MITIVQSAPARLRLAEQAFVRLCDRHVRICTGREVTVQMMSVTSEAQLSDEQSRSVATLIREELARRRMSRRQLADQARISISTLEKALSGRRPFTLATTIRLEEALGVSLRRNSVPLPSIAPPPSGLAPGDLGFYSRPAVAFIEGSYLTLRPSFGSKGAIYAYRTEITWDEASSSLIFRESERLDAVFSQEGSVSVPNQSGYIYLVTRRQGQYRLIIVARPTITHEMFGVITTLQVGRGAQLFPVSAPIAYVLMSTLPQAEFGLIEAGHPCFQLYRAYLRRTVDEQFALFLSV
jgi:transcriptional regulator with XRE-family HTH domain